VDYLFAPDRCETEGFVLRSYEPGDGLRLAVALNDSYEHLRHFLAWAQPETSVQSAEQRVRYFRAKWLLATDFVVAVVSTDGETILGGCGFHLRDGGLETGGAEIGMWIRRDAAACGLGTRVLVEMLRWGFDEWPWKRLTWECSPRNAASLRVAEKAGMEREGVRDGTVCFAALRSVWSAPEDVR